MERIIARIGEVVKHRRDTVWRAVVLLLIGWSAYNIGLISAQHGTVPAQSATLIESRTAIVSRTSTAEKGSPAPTPDHRDPRVVVSKTSSSKKYHYSWCSSGTRIKESNRVWYPSAAAAEAAGYSLAGNCTQ